MHASRRRSTGVQVQPLLNLSGIPFLACSTATSRKLHLVPLQHPSQTVRVSLLARSRCEVYYSMSKFTSLSSLFFVQECYIQKMIIIIITLYCKMKNICAQNNNVTKVDEFGLARWEWILTRNDREVGLVFNQRG